MNEFPELDRDDEIVRTLLAPFKRVRPVALPHRPARMRRSRRSYLARRLVPVLVLAAAALAIGLIAPWGHGRSFTARAVAERALVAIGNGPVLHAVVRAPGTRTYIDLATGQETPELITTEVWYDKERRFVHRQDSINGDVFADFLMTPFGSGKPKGWAEGLPYIPGLDPALAGFVDGYRSALENGDARVTGTGTVDGHDVTWIELTIFSESGVGERIAIDQASSLPVRIEQVYNGKIEQSFDVVSIETLPEGSGNFSKPAEDVSPNRWLGRDQVTTISQSDAAQALPGALWVGKSISALELSSVARARLLTQTNESAPSYETGIELHYGDGSAGRIFGDEPAASEKPSGTYVWLLEAAVLNPVYWSSLGPGEEPPAGSMLTDSGDQGFTVKDGINVTILASSHELLLEAARALEPIQVPASPTGN